MFVIRRRQGEVVRIGDEVELQLLSIGKTTVRLGIRAPRSIIVTMSEPVVEKAEKNSPSGRSVGMSGEL